MDIQQFQEPPKEYREVPFWSWNDDLDPEELRRQIALMDEGGWGGFFMHSRVGLRTSYMGRRWMACIRACVDEARERDMGAWLYDEDKWPSGFAGGLGVAPNPTHRATYLVCKVDDRPALVAERIATFAACEVDGRLIDIHTNDAPDLADDADRVIQFYPQTMALGFTWFNDYAYAALLNPDAVRAFLDVTHEVYARSLEEDFGRTVPGVFTDEPCVLYQGHGVPQLTTIPWTDDFPAIFRTRNGYDLLPHLPALFFNVGEFHGVRYDYWRTVTERFVESYTRQVYAWCEDHNLAYTGHYMAEDSLLSQIQWIGAAMPHYAYMHIPGIDKLGRTINGRAGTVLTVKQLDSAVCQLGKRRALCENYGCAGQDFAHAGRKWIGDWAYVLGVNLNNPHLSLYSMRGERKRDFPQNLFYQQPWWSENRLIADYFARLSTILSQGQRVVDILVVHPIGSAWSVYRPGASNVVDQLDRALDDLLMTLMQAQRDFHMGDEVLMEPGAPAEGHVTVDGGGPRLDVGQMAYRVVIVPPGVTLAENTARLLHEFAEAGGPVLASKPLPSMIDGRPTETPALPVTARIVTVETLPAALDEFLPFDVRVLDRPSIWAHHRRDGETHCYFLANTDLDRGGVTTVQLRGTGRLEAWDPATGAVSPLPSRQSEGITEVVLDFAPSGSHLLVQIRDQSALQVEPSAERIVGEMPLGDVWELALNGPNALTLDTPQVQIGDEGDWSRPMHVLDAHAVIAAAGPGTPFALRFTFDAAIQPASPVFLIAESPERFGVTVNGRPISQVDTGWWVDISFRRLDLGAAVRAGRNEIVLRGIFARDLELESVYVIGDFGVAGRRIGEESRQSGQIFDRYTPEFRIVALPECVQAKEYASGLSLDLTAETLPFFAGRATLRQTVRLPPFDGRVVLEVDGLRAAVAHVDVNRQRQGTVAWQPHRVDVTEGLRPGENVIEIELVGTLRNLLGPHHLAGGDGTWTGPTEFRDRSRWTDDYILVPFGIDGATLKAFRG